MRPAYKTIERFGIRLPGESLPLIFIYQAPAPLVKGNNGAAGQTPGGYPT